MIFIKPAVKLPELPFINKQLQAEFDNIQTRAQLVEFTIVKLNEAENETNSETKEALKAIAYPLYSYLTNISFESKIQL